MFAGKWTKWAGLLLFSGMVSCAANPPDVQGDPRSAEYWVYQLIRCAQGNCYFGTSSYTVGGGVTGLYAGQTVTLQLNGTESTTVSSNTSFVFTSKLSNGADYNIQVASTTNGANCVASTNTGIIASSNVTNVSVVCSSVLYTLRVNVSGLFIGETVVFLNNGGSNLSVTANGVTNFASQVPAGSGYNVTASGTSTPNGQTCTPSANTGTISGLTTIAVTCSPDLYTISGNYSGLNGNGLQIKLNNTGEILTYNNPPPAGPSGLTAFAFAAPVADTTAYTVVVQQNPSNLNQNCIVTNGNGTISGANVTNVLVTCTTNTYAVSGSASGMNGVESIVVLVNGGSNQTIGPSTTTNFSWNLNDGATYAVSVQAGSDTAIGKTCSVSNASGTIAGANVINVTISCAFNTYTVGGSVSGLCSGQSVQLQNNGGDTQTVNGSTTFTFAAQNDLAAYNVTVLSQPAGIVCNVTNGAGNLSNANVTNVSVACTGCMSCGGVNTFTAHWTASRSYDVSTASGGGHKIYYDVNPGITTSSPGMLNIPNTTSTIQGTVTGRTSGCTYYVRIQPYSVLNGTGGSLSGESSIVIP